MNNEIERVLTEIEPKLYKNVIENLWNRIRILATKTGQTLVEYYFPKKSSILSFRTESENLYCAYKTRFADLSIQMFNWTHHYLFC